MNAKLALEAVTVGILTAVIGILIIGIICYFVDINIFSNSKTISATLLGLFLTGLVIHLGCELTGVNKWYCQNGNACTEQQKVQI